MGAGQGGGEVSRTKKGSYTLRPPSALFGWTCSEPGDVVMLVLRRGRGRGRAVTGVVLASVRRASCAAASSGGARAETSCLTTNSVGQSLVTLHSYIGSSGETRNVRRLRSERARKRDILR